jgi:ornithine--oxo-acid transaminase
MYPVSCVLANDVIMLTIKPGEHGSTYGGNPIAAAVSVEALKIINDEKLTENSEKMGCIFRNEMKNTHSPMIEEVRGKGLLNAITIRPKNNKEAWDVCIAMKEHGLLAKPTHGHIIRFTPPLIITEDQMLDAVDRIKKTFSEFD